MVAVDGVAMQVEKPAKETSSSIWPAFMLREGIVAGPDYNRWLFPPAALLIQMAIGQVRESVSWAWRVLLFVWGLPGLDPLLSPREGNLIP